MTLTDELLLRYADGLLDRETAALVAAALATDEIAAERVRLMKISGEALMAEVAGSVRPGELYATTQRFLGEARHNDGAVLRPKLGRSIFAPPGWSGSVPAHALAAGFLVAIGLGIGFASGSQWRESSVHPVWVMRVVDYHTLYSRSTIAANTVSPAETKALELRFTQVLGRAIKIPAYAASAMEFRRGQILEFEGAPIIQLAYLPAHHGAPMALCLKVAAGPDTLPTFERLHGIGTIRWRHTGLDYVLVGDQGEQDLREYARQAIEQFATAGRT